MIDVKDASLIAQDYFREVYKGIATDLLLEEVEFTSDDRYWLITLSFNTNKFGDLGGAGTRKYKQFEIDAKSGVIKSMKIREIK